MNLTQLKLKRIHARILRIIKEYPYDNYKLIRLESLPLRYLVKRGVIKGKIVLMEYDTYGQVQEYETVYRITLRGLWYLFLLDVK